MSRIILIFSYETSDEEIIDKIRLSESLNYKTIIVKICNNKKLNFYSYKEFNYDKFLKKISNISNAVKNNNVLFNIDATEESLDALLRKVELLEINKNNIFLDYFIEKEIQNEKIIEKSFHLIGRVDLNIINTTIKNNLVGFKNIDSYKEILDFNISKESEETNENEYIKNLNLPIILNKLNDGFELYLFGKTRYIKTNIFINEIDKFEIIEKKVKSYLLKKKIKNNLCIGCNKFISCYESDIFNSYDPKISCEVLKKMLK